MRIDEHDSGDLTGTDRGEQFGHVWADRIRSAAAAYRDHYRRLDIDAGTVTSIAEASHEALRDWCPPLAAELESVAHGANLSVPEIGMLNARTEILAAGPGAADGECSTAVRVPVAGAAASKTSMAFQTWDWHAHLVPHAALWRYAPSPGNWVKTFTEPGMLAKIGLNSRGLAANFNILHHREDGASGGVPVHAIARRILDEATTVDDARTIAESARVSASTAITVLATAGDRAEAASLEITPAGAAAVGIDADGWLVRTNHLLAPELRDGNASPATSTTVARRDHLRSAVPHDASPELAALAHTFCGSAGAGAPICVTEDPRAPQSQRLRTLLTVRMDPVAGTLEYVAGDPWDAADSDSVATF